MCLFSAEDPRELVTLLKQKSVQVPSKEEQGPVLHVCVMLSPFHYPSEELPSYPGHKQGRVLGSRTRKHPGGSYRGEAVGTGSWALSLARLQLHALEERGA